MSFVRGDNQPKRQSQGLNANTSRSNDLLARYQYCQDIKNSQVLAEAIKGEIPVGFVNNSDLIFGLRKADAPKNGLVIGLPGVGKTTCCHVLIDGILKNTDATIVFFDKKGSEKNLYPYLTQVLDKSEILFLSPEINLCENPFQPPHQSLSYQEWYRIICNVLLPSLGLRFEAGNALIAGAYKAKIKLPDNINPSIFDIYPCLTELRPNKYSEHVKSDYFSRGEFRLEMCILNLPRVFSYRRGMPFDEYRKKRFILIDLSRTDDFTAKIIVESMVAKVFHYQIAQNQEQDASFFLFFDEAQHYYSNEKIQTFTGISPLEEYIRMTRASGIWQILANQSYSSLSHGARTMAGFKILFKIDPSELKYIKESMLLSDQDIQYIDNLEVGEAIVKLDSRPGMPLFKINVPEFKVKKDNAQSYVFEPIHERYDCLPIPEEQRLRVINQILGEQTKPTATMTEVKQKADLSDESKITDFLINIAEKPFYQFAERLSDLRYGDSLAESDRIKKLITERGYATEYKYKLKKGRGSKASYLEISKEGRKYLEDKGYKQKNRHEGKSGFLHSLIVYKLVKPHYESKYQVKVEGTNKGNDADLAVYDGEKKAIAVEVSYTTTSDDEMRNIQRNIKSGHEKVQIIVIATSNDNKAVVEDEPKAQAKKQSFIEAFKANLDEVILSKLDILTIKEFRDLA